MPEVLLYYAAQSYASTAALRHDVKPKAVLSFSRSTTSLYSSFSIPGYCSPVVVLILKYSYKLQDD